MECHNCPNHQCLIKKHCRQAPMESFLVKKHSLQCKKTQSFILEGAPVHGLYFVRAGQVKVAKTGRHGKEQIVRFATGGDIVGHRGFGAGEFYQISATALTNTTLCHFSSSTMLHMLHQVPGLTVDMMLFYADELNRSESKVKKFAQMNVREKVIDSLLQLHRKFGQHRGLLNIQLSRKELSDLAGTTEEQVIRTLSTLRKEEQIRTEGKKIGIINVELLNKEISNHQAVHHI